MVASHGLMIADMGDTNEDMVVVCVAVTVGYQTGLIRTYSEIGVSPPDFGQQVTGASCHFHSSHDGYLILGME